MNLEENQPFRNQIGKQLQTNWLFKLGEIFLLFFIVVAFVALILPLVGDNLILKQLIVWAANIMMLIFVWAGMRLRGEKWSDFGLTFKSISVSEAMKVFLLSVLVMVLAIVGFVIGSIIMANITGIPEGSNLGGYDYLNDNIGMLLLTLGGVYIASSFGEEVIYRAFLINRISELGQNTKKATIVAIILSSIIFGLIHYDWGPMGIVQTGFMGLVLGICYIKLKKRLWVLILAHAYMDTILMVQLYLASN
ncbi:type II CAAX endopeptidase family protein [uncultured Eudoraea sp.]|uniref:CPBP family intramembrane glutamic endopeptidase n=1 Tax=uncultured Eudoraea sp. TaxID=1035614 RepID=UPI00260AA2E2|nr:type II CAAX endopeptidase family protein [uncultured Eudoraea sp.]